MSAGNQLFHVVVDNDDVATRITALLTEQRAGRVTFIPLNRINPQPVQYPDFGDDALPLVNKINCAEQHTKAVAQARSPPPPCREGAGSGVSSVEDLRVSIAAEAAIPPASAIHMPGRQATQICQYIAKPSQQYAG